MPWLAWEGKHLGPIDRTPDTPGSGKNLKVHKSCFANSETYFTVWRLAMDGTSLCLPLRLVPYLFKSHIFLHTLIYNLKATQASRSPVLPTASLLYQWAYFMIFIAKFCNSVALRNPVVRRSIFTTRVLGEEVLFCFISPPIPALL